MVIFEEYSEFWNKIRKTFIADPRHAREYKVGYIGYKQWLFDLGGIENNNRDIVFVNGEDALAIKLKFGWNG